MSHGHRVFHTQLLQDYYEIFENAAISILDQGILEKLKGYGLLHKGSELICLGLVLKEREGQKDCNGS